MLTIKGVTYIYRQIDCPSIIEFVRMLELEEVTYFY
jgi:hypothetical protein